MRLVFLGTAGYHPNEQRQTHCLLLPDCGVMFDAGTGMYRAPYYLQTSTLDIFLTHVHLDHVFGLTFLFHVLRVHPLESVTIHASPRELAALDEHLFAPALFPKKPPCHFRPLVDVVPLPQGGRLTHFSLVHPGGSRGYRLDWPSGSLAYVTDTTAEPGAAYVERIRGVDVLLHECFFRDDQPELARQTGHSCTSAVAQVARDAGVGRLLLVHVNPLETGADPVGLAAARAIFPASEIARDLQEIEF
jgi:ribonuclease BN (tRNA processing enzyme)